MHTIKYYKDIYGIHDAHTCSMENGAQIGFLSIIIPLYNENPNIAPLYERTIKAIEKLDCDFEIIFIDDGSVDGSSGTLDELAREDQRIKVVHFRRNFGQTAALMAGIDFSSGDVIVTMDGDLQNDPDDIPNLLTKLEEGFDVCSGWRKYRKDPIMRRWPSRIANLLISQISGVHLQDYGCTLKAYRRSALDGVRLYGEMHRFVPIYATWQGARVTEIPVKHHNRIHGESKYGLERTIKVILDLILVKFLAGYSQKPIYVFGSIGILSLAFAFLSALGAFYCKYVNGTSFIQTPLPLIFVMTSIMGIMCILMGLLAEIIIRIYYESQDKSVYLVSNCQNISNSKHRAYTNDKHTSQHGTFEG